MLKIENVVLLEGFKDRLGRLYGRTEVFSSVFKKRLIGELVDNNAGLTVDLSKVSHAIDNIAVVDDNLVGDITVLDTPMGIVIQNLMNAGVEFAPSIRGSGIVNSNAEVSSLSLLTFDLKRM